MKEKRKKIRLWEVWKVEFCPDGAIVYDEVVAVFRNEEQAEKYVTLFAGSVTIYGVDYVLVDGEFLRVIGALRNHARTERFLTQCDILENL